MRKISYLLCVLFILLSLSACSKVEKVDGKEVAETLIEYIELGDYDSAANMFCDDKDIEGKTFPDLLNEFEKTTGLDFQSGIEIVECTNYISKYSGMYGTIPCAFLEFQVTIDEQTVIIDIDMMKTEDKIECFFFNLEYKNELYQYVCDNE